jgi:hypothetical protein
MHDVVHDQSNASMAVIRRPSLTRFATTFGFAWLMIGLFTGTLVLVLLVRWVLGLVHYWGWGQSAENRVLLSIILAFIVASFALTRVIVRRLFRLTTRRGQRIAVSLLILPGGVSLWAWSNPTRVLAGLAGTTSSTVSLAGGPVFIFGAYPDGARLEELKREGVRTVISLQHPAVLVELQGIQAEREETRRLGLDFVQVPMLPWISDNSAALVKLRELAEHGSGRYYVHCGLGRDRVNIAKRVIESVGDAANVRIASHATLQTAMGFEDRLNAPFQRGRVFQLEPDVWLIPFPNADELYSKILQGRAGQVFFLVDLDDTAQVHAMRETEPQLRQYVVPFTVIPFAAKDTAAAAQAFATIRAAPRPTTIVVPATSWGGPRDSVLSAAAGAVFRAYGLIPATKSPKRTAHTTPHRTAKKTAAATVRPPRHASAPEHVNPVTRLWRRLHGTR